MRAPASLTAIFLCAAAVHAQDKPPRPVLIRIGRLQMKPSGFLELIGLTRTETTSDTISTRFGNIPLTDTPTESLGSPRHSRLMLKSELPARSMVFTTYLESDFLNPDPTKTYRWRQYWGRARYGNWEVLGGQAWSLLRPNRVGIDSDKDVMNTDVIEPNYHVGLVGQRLRQVRVAHAMGEYKAVVAWENVGNVLTKVVRDRGGTHLEGGGLWGRSGRRALTASAVVGITPRARIATQQYWSKHATQYALGVVPAGVNGMTTIEGVEAQLHKTFEVYAYGGLVYGARGLPSGNRLVREWSAGFNQRWNTPQLAGAIMLSFEYSYVDRAIWAGNPGQMHYLMYRLRYTFN